MARLALPDPPLGDGVISLRGFESTNVAGLHAIDRASACAEIGFMLAAHARGRGAASRAVALLAGWAFGPLGLERLELHIDRDNAASLAVAERTGFTRVAAPVIRRAEWAHFADDIFFARLRTGAPAGG